MNVKRKARTVGQCIAINSILHVCKTSLQHGHIHRRMQIAIVIERYGKTWKSPVVKTLVDKYGAHEC